MGRPRISWELIMAQYSQKDVLRLRQQLEYEAEKIRSDPDFSQRPDWIDPQKWSFYMGKQGRMLYQSFSDGELLSIITSTAQQLGRVPAQRDVFCVYRDFIRRRFGNWVKALQAAGLKEVKNLKL